MPHLAAAALSIRYPKARFLIVAANPDARHRIDQDLAKRIRPLQPLVVLGDVGRAAAVLAAAGLAVGVVKNEYFFYAAYIVLTYVVLATAWNILGGYAGYVNFGTSAFFGIGVYTAVFLLKAVEAPLFVQIPAAAAVGALLGLGTGLLTLRLQGIFFWDLFIYLVEGLVFLLTGLQARIILEQANSFTLRELVTD